MNNAVIATSAADAAAVEAVEQHHALLAGALAIRVEALVAAASRGDTAAVPPARNELVRWCTDELVPHAAAEERVLYPAARGKDTGRLLVDGMIAEHAVITGLVDEISGTADAIRAAAAAHALQTMSDNHLGKENELLLPLLAGAADVSVSDLLDGMHELVGHEPHPHESGCGSHACSCGETDAPGHPELDVRAVPHAIRHATVFGALDSVRLGGGLVLVAPHDPIPLLGQIEQRWPGVFAVNYLERGPEAWRLSFLRRGSDDHHSARSHH